MVAVSAIAVAVIMVGQDITADRVMGMDTALLSLLFVVISILAAIVMADIDILTVDTGIHITDMVISEEGIVVGMGMDMVAVTGGIEDTTKC